ncbi:MAG: metal-dependent phosphohydrolase [Cellvibrionales bacterium]|nr:MAG: metal-dependent phosphohydrolase [Cellvibrionales bacterium]
MGDKPKGTTKGSPAGKTSGGENLVRVDIAHLKMGMYVVELDRPWLETPFLMQGFELRNKAQLRTLEKYCQHVFIRSRSVTPKKQPQPAVRVQPPKLTSKAEKGTFFKPTGRVKKPQKRRIIRSRPAYEVTLSVREEHPVAESAYRKGKADIKEILHSAQFGQMLNTEVAEEIVSSCVESMLRHPDAMIWMSRIKHESEYTAEHCLNVCILAIAFGRHLHFDEADLQILGLCGLLHDVGKMRTPKVILNKRGALTEEEFAVMKQHTIDGHKLLKEDGGASTLPIDVVLNHHERPDGKGYPRGLKAGEISEYARIIAIVDAYDAITSDRCYSKAVSPVDAQKEIYQNRGKQFDEEYALAFMQAIGPYPPGTIVELHNGMVGLVLSGQRKFRHLPTVVILRNEEKQVIDEKTVDLYLTDSGQLDKGFLIRRTLPDGSFDIKLEDFKIKLNGDPGASE